MIRNRVMIEKSTSLDKENREQRTDDREQMTENR